MKTHFMFNNFFYFPLKTVPFIIWWGQRGHRWQYNTVHSLCMLTCWITNATDTLSEQVILIFHATNDFGNALQCYFIRILPLFFIFEKSEHPIMLSEVLHDFSLTISYSLGVEAQTASWAILPKSYATATFFLAPSPSAREMMLHKTTQEEYNIYR